MFNWDYVEKTSFEKAVNAVTKNPKDFEGDAPTQVHLAQLNCSILKNGVIYLQYETGGDYRTNKTVTLAKVPISALV